ncbi:MAG: ABC transporter ATP-binding protein/permease [Lachnospiraceae bacterium]|nr:ABC transporter ATP-binding protein/permease [Lachnospiraceae bacterium]
MRNVLKKLSPFIAPYKSKIIFAVFIGVVGSCVNLFVPDAIKNISNVIQDGIKGNIDLTLVKRYGIVALIAVVVVLVCNVLSGRLMAKYGRSVGRDLRNAINNKINHITIAKMDSLSPGELIARSVSDVSAVESIIARVLCAIIVNLVMIIGSVVMMFKMSVSLSLCVIVSVLLGSFISTVITKKTTPIMKAQRTEMAFMNAQIDESLNGHMLIKAFNAEEDVKKAFNDNNERIRKDSKKAQFLSSVMTPMMSLTNNISYAVVVIFGAYLSLHGNSDITIGVIIAFVMYSRMFAAPVSTLAGTIPQIMLTSVSADRIVDLLDMPENEDVGTKTVDNLKGRVVFDNVRFGYSENKEIIHGFSATIEPGMKVAIVGPTGAGKSTIINLLMRFYEINSGSISIDGVDIKDMKREELHRILGMVLQETWVFTGTITENLIYSTQGVTKEQLKQVILDCGLQYLISTLPDGMDTVLNGDSISAGQKQLVTIGRVMLKNPDILILDEATSSVDTRTEKLIQDAIDKLASDKTSFVIAHRLSTIKNADLIFFLKDGDIVECGKHEELLERGGAYAELYNSQFSKK